MLRTTMVNMVTDPLLTRAPEDRRTGEKDRVAGRALTSCFTRPIITLPTDSINESSGKTGTAAGRPTPLRNRGRRVGEKLSWTSKSMTPGVFQVS